MSSGKPPIFGHAISKDLEKKHNKENIHFMMNILMYIHIA